MRDGIKEAEEDALREPHKNIYVLTEEEANREAYEESLREEHFDDGKGWRYC